MNKLNLKLLIENKRRVAQVLIVLAALMVLNGIYQLGMHIYWRSWISEVQASLVPTTPPTTTRPTATQPATTQPTATQPTDTQPSDKKDAKKEKKDKDKQKKKKSIKAPEIHAAIKKRNIFTKYVGPQGHGMTLTGVIADVALFKNKDGQTVGVEVGKSGHGIKVVEINNYEVIIEHKGKKHTLKLFTDKGFTDRSPMAMSETGRAKPGAKRAEATATQPKPVAGPANREQMMNEMKKRMKIRRGPSGEIRISR